MTIDQALEYLFANKQWRKSTEITASTLSKWESRYKAGNMKDLAKLNLIRRSGVFEENINFELKETR